MLVFSWYLILHMYPRHHFTNSCLRICIYKESIFVECNLLGLCYRAVLQVVFTVWIAIWFWRTLQGKEVVHLTNFFNTRAIQLYLAYGPQRLLQAGFGAALLNITIIVIKNHLSYYEIFDSITVSYIIYTNSSWSYNNNNWKAAGWTLLF